MNNTTQSLNELTHDKLIQYLDKLEGAVSTGGEFVAEQAPLVIQEILRWELVSHSILLFGAVLLFTTLWAGRGRFVKWSYNNESMPEHNTNVVASFFACIILSAFPVSISALAIHNIARVLTAPRLVIIEKIQEML